MGKMSMKMRKMSMKMSKKMRKMAMKKSVIAKGKRGKSSVFRGTKEKTSGGLKKSDLKRNKRGKIVSKAASDATRKGKGYKKIIQWSNAFKAARRALGIKGFCPCGGKTAKGKALLAKTRSLYKK